MYFPDPVRPACGTGPAVHPGVLQCILVRYRPDSTAVHPGELQCILVRYRTGSTAVHPGALQCILVQCHLIRASIAQYVGAVNHSTSICLCMQYSAVFYACPWTYLTCLTSSTLLHFNTCTHSLTHASNHAHTHTHMHTRMRACTHTHAHSLTHAHTHTHFYTHPCTHTHKHACTHRARWLSCPSTATRLPCYS